METISIKESFERIEEGASIVFLYTLKNPSIIQAMEQVCDLVRQHNDIVPIVRVEIDPETLTREEARLLSIMRVPQLHFYGGGIRLGALTGRITPSEVYERLLAIYS